MMASNQGDYEDDYEDDDLWEKPAWAKGGLALKKTGKADNMKKDGNLAAPITNIREDKETLKKLKEKKAK
jgi:hypothetical protein